MYIKSIVWRKLIYGQVRRLTLGIDIPNNFASFKKLRADHALEWGNRNENPGIWGVLTDSDVIPVTPDYLEISLDNSRNNLRLWQGDNDPRGSKIKISQRIWNETIDIIDVWYLGCMKILGVLLDGFNSTGSGTYHSQQLSDFINGQLNQLPKYKGDLFKWAKDTQGGFRELTINPEFLFDDYFIKRKKDYIGRNYLLVMRFIDEDGAEKTHALMVDMGDPCLHPILRRSISNDWGFVEINKNVE